MLVANLLSYAHNVARQLKGSERETAKGLDAVIENGSISCLLVIELDAVSITGAPLLRGLVWESKPAVIAASNMFAFAVLAVHTLIVTILVTLTSLTIISALFVTVRVTPRLFTTRLLLLYNSVSYLNRVIAASLISEVIAHLVNSRDAVAIEIFTLEAGVVRVGVLDSQDELVGYVLV